MAIGVPGWPEFACWTASMASVRMVSMHSRSVPSSPRARSPARVAVIRCPPGRSPNVLPSRRSWQFPRRVPGPARILDRPRPRSVAGSDPALVRLEPPRPPGLPGTLARLVCLERRHVDARHERRVAHDRTRAVAAHGVAHADGDQPAVLPPGAAGRRPRRHRRPPPAAPRDPGMDAGRCDRARRLYGGGPHGTVAAALAHLLHGPRHR